MIPKLTDLQNSVTEKPKRIMIRYSESEWEILAKAILAEWSASPHNLGLSMIQIANQAQENQKTILLDGESDPHVQWPTRHFTAVIQIMPALNKMFKIIEDQKMVQSLFNSASDENRQLRTKIAQIEKELTALKEKKSTLSDFADAEIIAEASFIQANHSEQIFKASTTINKNLEDIKKALSDGNIKISSSVSESKEDMKGYISNLFSDFNKLLKFTVYKKNTPVPSQPTITMSKTKDKRKR